MLTNMELAQLSITVMQPREVEIEKPSWKDDPAGYMRWYRQQRREALLDAQRERYHICKEDRRAKVRARYQRRKAQ